MSNYSKFLSLINGVPRTVDLSNNSNVLELGGAGLQLDGSTSGHVVINASATTTTYSLVLPATQAASAGYVLTNDGTGHLSWTNPSSGSVTSVGLSLPSIFTVTNSPVTSSGTLTATFNTQPANYGFFGPASGSAAAPTFRALVANDIPSLSAIYLPLSGGTLTGTLNGTDAVFSSTISASNFSGSSSGTNTGDQTITLTGDVTGSGTGSFATSIVATSNSTLTTLSALSLPTSQLSGSISLTTQVSGILPVANGGTGQSSAAAAFNALNPMTTTGDMIYESATSTASRLPIGSSGQVLTVSGGVPTWSAPATSGTVTSVGFADTSTTPIFTITNSPITSSGTIDQTLKVQSANLVFAGPSTGSAAQPSFRSLVANDIPDISATYVTQSEVGAINGVASLDASGKVPLSQLPSTLMEFKGSWNPNTNTPTLVDGTGTTGFTYWVSAADANPVSGLTDPSMTNFQIGDLVIYNGTKWVLVTPAAGVQSVNGAQGAVTVNAINQLTGDVTSSSASGSQSEATTVAKIQGTTVSGTTGSGNVVFSASPTFTGTITAEASNFSGAISALNFSGSSSGTNTGDVTLGTANGLSLSGQILSLGTSSASTTGALSSTDWSTFNAKQNALTFGDLTDVGTDGITVTGGTAAVIGSGTSISQHVADASHNGYLSSTDWSTFNNKLTSTLASANIFVGNASNVATAVSMSGDVTIDNTGATTIGAAKITLSKMASNSVDENKIVSTAFSSTGAISGGSGTKISANVDGSTIDINGSNQLEVKAAGISATQLATGAFDQVTITGGAGTAASVVSAPANIQMFTAGESFGAGTSFAVRMALPSDSGYVAGSVYKADQDATSADKFWVIGIAYSAAGVSAGGSIAVTSLGSLASGVTFVSGDIGKPIYLTSAGAFSTTAPSTSGYANFKLGNVESTSSMFVNLNMMGIA